MRKRTLAGGLLLLFLCFTLVSCSDQQPGQNELTYTAFVKKLQQTDTRFTYNSATRSNFFSGTPYGLSINAEHISIFEYATSAEVQKEASRISPRGDKVQTLNGAGTAIVDWVATPHFYKSGRIIVLYTGDQQNTIALLQSLLGPQFAGGDSMSG